MPKEISLSKGAWFMLQSTAWFALMNVFAKLVNHLPATEIVFFRCFVSMLFCMVALQRFGVSPVGKNKGILLARGASGTFSLFLYLSTIKHMPLGTAVTIQYISPIFTVILAMLFMSERVSVWQWLFFIISFSGVFLIKGFDNRVEMIYLIAGLISAFFSGVAYNLIRSLKGNEHPTVVVFHFMLIGTIAGGIGMLFQFQMPVGMEWFYLFMIGLTTQFGQVTMTKALQISNVTEVSILNYLGVIYAVLFGYFLFDESLHLLTIGGIALVVAGVIANVAYSSRKKT